jgi:hypothetical protein
MAYVALAAAESVENNVFGEPWIGTREFDVSVHGIQVWYSSGWGAVEVSWTS